MSDEANADNRAQVPQTEAQHAVDRGVVVPAKTVETDAESAGRIAKERERNEIKDRLKQRYLDDLPEDIDRNIASTIFEADFARATNPSSSMGEIIDSHRKAGMDYAELKYVLERTDGFDSSRIDDIRDQMTEEALEAAIADLSEGATDEGRSRLEAFFRSNMVLFSPDRNQRVEYVAKMAKQFDEYKNSLDPTDPERAQDFRGFLEGMGYRGDDAFFEDVARERLRQEASGESSPPGVPMTEDEARALRDLTDHVAVAIDPTGSDDERRTAGEFVKDLLKSPAYIFLRNYSKNSLMVTGITLGVLSVPFIILFYVHSMGGGK